MVWDVLLFMSIALLLAASLIESLRRPKLVTRVPARERKLLAVTFKGNLESRADARSMRAFAPILFLMGPVLLVILIFSGTASPL